MTSQRSFPNAVKWAYAANWGEKALGGFFTFVLAALLGPREFGVMAIAMAYILFLQMFLDQGFMAALIQKKDLEAEHLDAVFWMDLLLSVFLILVSIALSGWWSSMTHSPDAGRVIIVLSLCIPIEALACVQGAILKREMDFKALSIRSNIAALVGGAAGISMAVAGFKVWALVGQQVTRDLTALILLWNLSRWRPRAEFSGRHLKQLTTFSISNFIAQLGIFAELQSSPLLLGFFFGPMAVGLYRIADRLTSGIVSLATTSIQSVSLPEFARVQGYPKSLRTSVVSCIRLSSVVTLPTLTVMGASSYHMLATLGPNWIPAANTLKILSLFGMSSVFAYFTGPLLQALSRTRELAILEWGRMGVGALFIVGAGVVMSNATAERQSTAIALARLLSVGCLVTPVFLWILIRLSGISWRDVKSAVAPSIICSVGALGAILLFQFSQLMASRPPIASLAAEIVIGIAVGVAVLLMFDAALRELFRLRFRRLFGSQAGAPANRESDRWPELGAHSPVMREPTAGSGLQNTLVSVVIPTYNRARTLGDALGSVLTQNHKNVQVILVDDGSADNTRELVEAINDNRIRYILHDRNRGCSAAYNTGISAASGRFIAFLDSDDMWKPGYLERHLTFLNSHPEIYVSFCDTEIHAGDVVIPSLIQLMSHLPKLLTRPRGVGEYVFSRREMRLCLLEEIPVKPSATVVRREVLARVGIPFEESWPSGTDWDLFIRLSWVAGFGYIDKALAIQRRTADATHQRFLEKDKIFVLCILRRERSRVATDPAALRAVNRGIARAHNSLAWYYVRAGRHREAMRVYLEALVETRRPFLLEKLASEVIRIVVSRSSAARQRLDTAGRD